MPILDQEPRIFDQKFPQVLLNVSINELRKYIRQFTSLNSQSDLEADDLGILRQTEIILRQQLGDEIVELLEKKGQLKTKTDQRNDIEKRIIQLLSDYAYAIEYWENELRFPENTGISPKILKMLNDIELATEQGVLELDISENTTALDEHRRASAYKTLIRQLGYKPGNAIPQLSGQNLEIKIESIKRF